MSLSSQALQLGRMLSDDEIENTVYHVRRLYVPQLKLICKSLNLGLKGKRQDLIDRIEHEIYRNKEHGLSIKLLALRTVVLKIITNDPVPEFDSLYEALRSGLIDHGLMVNQLAELLNLANQVRGKPRALNASLARLEPRHALMMEPYAPNYLGPKLRFQNLIFYLLHMMLPRFPFIVPVAKGRTLLHIPVKLASSELQLLRSTPRMRLYLFCGMPSAPDPNRADIQFPPIEIHVDGLNTKQYVKGLKGKPGTCRPADLTKYASDQQFTINVVYSDANEMYLIYLYIVEARTPEELVQYIVQKKGHILAQATRNEIIREYELNQDDDIVMATSTLSLRCPLTYARMVVPMRSIECDHIQCFDGLSFLTMQERIPSWICPVCLKKIDPHRLAISDYIKEILDSTSDDVDSVNLGTDGSWEAVVEETKEESRTPVAQETHDASIEVISLDSDSDDNADVTMKSANSTAINEPANKEISLMEVDNAEGANNDLISSDDEPIQNFLRRSRAIDAEDENDPQAVPKGTGDETQDHTMDGIETENRMETANGNETQNGIQAGEGNETQHRSKANDTHAPHSNTPEINTQSMSRSEYSDVTETAETDYTRMQNAEPQKEVRTDRDEAETPKAKRLKFPDDPSYSVIDTICQNLSRVASPVPEPRENMEPAQADRVVRESRTRPDIDGEITSSLARAVSVLPPIPSVVSGKQQGHSNGGTLRPVNFPLEAHSATYAVSPTMPQSKSPAIPQSKSPAIPQSKSPAIPQSILPAMRQSSSPKITQSASPRIVQSSSPKVAQASLPKVVQSSSPKVAQVSLPKVVQSSSPKVVQSSSPKVVQSSSPKVAQVSLPKVAQSSSPTIAQSASPGITTSASPIITNSASPITQSASPTMTQSVAPQVLQGASPAVSGASLNVSPSLFPVREADTRVLGKNQTHGTSKGNVTNTAHSTTQALVNGTGTRNTPISYTENRDQSQVSGQTQQVAVYPRNNTQSYNVGKPGTLEVQERTSNTGATVAYGQNPPKRLQNFRKLVLDSSALINSYKILQNSGRTGALSTYDEHPEMHYGTDAIARHNSTGLNISNSMPNALAVPNMGSRMSSDILPSVNRVLPPMLPKNTGRAHDLERRATTGSIAQTQGMRYSRSPFDVVRDWSTSSAIPTEKVKGLLGIEVPSQLLTLEVAATQGGTPATSAAPRSEPATSLPDGALVHHSRSLSETTVNRHNPTASQIGNQERSHNRQNEFNSQNQESQMYPRTWNRRLNKKSKFDPSQVNQSNFIDLDEE